MKINVTFLEELVKAFLQDESTFIKNALKSKAGRAFLIHEQMLNRKTTVKKVVKSFEQGDNQYNFQFIKKNLDQIESIKKYICENQIEISETLLNQVSKYTKTKVNSDIEICFYALGYDGGFFLFGNTLFVNLAQCMERWFSIVAHELYHSRKIKLNLKIKRAFCNMGVFSNLFIKFKMGVLCWEEGNATLVEHDGEKPDDYDEIMNQYKELKQMLSSNKIKKKEIWSFFNSQNLRYKIGWLIAYDHYKQYGASGLDCCLKKSLKTFNDFFKRHVIK